MRVSKETAVLLKDAGYDVACDYGICEDGAIVKRDSTMWSDWIIAPAPTLHEAADWLRSKGVHVYPVFTGKKGWLYGVGTFDCSVFGISKDYYPSHEAAYEAGIVHALKYVK